jgi:hypothetical protein
MRGLWSGLPVLLVGAGCIYLEEPNYAPTITIHATRDGPYFRDEAITVVAEVGDRNPEDRDKLEVRWTLAGADGAPLPVGAAADCGGDTSGCFVPRLLGTTYRMTATVTDARGAKSAVAADFAVDNRPPTAALEVRGLTWPENGHYRLLSPIVFSPLPSGDPDADDLCDLRYDVVFAARPVLGAAKLEPCPDADVRQGCGPVLTKCLRPDVDGSYRIKLTVTDSAGATATAETSIEVDPDHRPCLRQLDPAPVTRLFVSRSDPPVTLGVNVVEDDLDPFPPASTNEPEYPRFVWSLKTPADAEPVAILGYGRNYYRLDQTAFSAGDEITVRVDALDRTDVASPGERPVCDPDEPVCPPTMDPLAECVQRVTWTLEVY